MLKKDELTDVMLLKVFVLYSNVYMDWLHLLCEDLSAGRETGLDVALGQTPQGPS